MHAIEVNSCAFCLLCEHLVSRVMVHTRHECGINNFIIRHELKIDRRVYSFNFVVLFLLFGLPLKLGQLCSTSLYFNNFTFNNPSSKRIPSSNPKVVTFSCPLDFVSSQSILHRYKPFARFAFCSILRQDFFLPLLFWLFPAKNVISERTMCHCYH